MTCLLILAIYAILALLSANAHAVVLIDTDFGDAAQKVDVADPDKELRVTGRLPNGWIDNSSWASVQAEYLPMVEERLPFLRIHVGKITDGRCQLAYRPLPDLHRENYYRLSLKARSSSYSSINLGIRTQGSPYRFLWEKRQQFSESWQKCSFDFRVPPSQQPIGFWIALDSEGTVDIANLKLIEYTKDELMEEMRSSYTGSRYRNLLRVSQFPLGLQSGWSLDRDDSDGDDVIISADSDMTGLGGIPSLHIKSADSMRLYTAPFAIPIAFEKHTASLYIRGVVSGRFSVICDGRPIASRNLETGDEWKRLQVTFEPKLMSQAYGIRIEAQGDFWIDAMQVEPGEEAKPYSSQLDCEVSLACTEGDASAALVHFEDEPALIRYCVSGKANEANLRFRVVNVYGDEKLLPGITLDAMSLQYGESEYKVFPERPFGTFRIEAWVEKSDGERISPCNELVVHRLRRPRYWMEDAPGSYFGVHTTSTTRHILMAKAVGVNWVRLHDAGLDYLGWYHLEPQQGQWKFRDKELYRYRRLGMKILGELGTAPKWASYYQDVGRDHSGYFDRFYQPKRLEDYANYVRTVTRRYAGVIDAYDIWNEPWIHAWWGVGYDESKSDREGYLTSEDPTGDFAKLMATAYQNAKATDEAITILGVNSTTGTGGSRSFGGSEWTQGVIEHGGLDYCDVVCYHHYTGESAGFPGDVIARGFQTAIGPIVERFGRKPKPVWMTEGSPTAGRIGSGFYNHTVPYQDPEDIISTADRLCRYIVSLLTQGVEKIFLYSMHSHSYFPNAGTWRVLVTDEGALHPCGAAHSAMAWFIEDTEFVKTLEITEGVYAYVFEGSERAVAVLSSKSGHAEFSIPQEDGVHIADLFGNPVEPGSKLGDNLVYLWTSRSKEKLLKLFH